MTLGSTVLTLGSTVFFATMFCAPVAVWPKIGFLNAPLLLVVVGVIALDVVVGLVDLDVVDGVVDLNVADGADER